MENKSPEEIINRIRLIMKDRRLTQGQMAHELGVDPSNMSKHLNGHLPITEGLINRIVLDMGISKKWLVDGYGDMNRDHENDRPQGTPVYDIDVTAGYTQLSMMFTQDRVVGYINLPEVSSECVVVKVSGDSMEPTIRNGSLVAIRQVKDTRLIFWGQIYVVVLDDYRLVKMLRRNNDPDKVTLHSSNPQYDDMEIQRSDIRALFLVETILNFDRRY